MTDSRLLHAIARILRAAAEEAERCAAEADPPRQQGEIRTSGRPVSEVAAQRARAALRRAGILSDP